MSTKFWAETLEHDEIMLMRNHLKKIRSHEFSVMVLSIVIAIVLALGLFTRSETFKVPNSMLWILCSLPILITIVQWFKYALIAKQFRSKKVLDEGYCQDFYQISVWEPRCLIYTVIFFEALVVTTKFLGPDLILGIKYSIFPIAIASLGSCSRGYLRAKDLTKRLISRQTFIANQKNNKEG